MFEDSIAVVKGAGELASGVAFRLRHAGFRVVMTELEQPLCVCRAASFAEAIPRGRKALEGVEAEYVASVEAALAVLDQGRAAILVDEQARAVEALKPAVVVDAIMAKRNTGTSRSDAPLVIGLGPGFVAGQDVHAVIETKRGHTMGRVLLNGSAAPNTGVPELIDGHTINRLLLAPASGTLSAERAIGDRVQAGDLVARVGGLPVVAGISGVVRGLLPDGYAVDQGMKVGDLDPSAEPEFCYTLSDRALAIGSGALAAVLELWPRTVAGSGDAPGRRRGRRPPQSPDDDLLSVGEYTLLGLLRERPAHGYDLSKVLQPETDLGAVVRLGLSQLYASLAKLETHGFVRGEAASSLRARGRRVFHVSDAGERRFLDWVTRPVQGARHIRVDFLTKLYFARRLDGDAAVDLVATQIDVLKGEVRASSAAPPSEYRQEVLAVTADLATAALAWLERLPEANELVRS
ncbi:MAG: EF2563 family selenium-dependent molybdenum hydroxylase system protein [Chloroflexi bacterium]|nr:EF2563 family selenium-dependent molybdenum hydroxylase system protein [Chloroflexota bacterium]